MTLFKITASAMALVLMAPMAVAETWTLNGDMSNIAFGSVKNEYNGEVHHFSTLSCSVDAQGQVVVSVPLASVETMIDIRNERMRELVFKNSPTATVSATVDMVALDKLGVGESMVAETEGTLSLLGQEVALYSDLFVIRVGEDKVMVTTDGMLMLATDELGVDAAIDQLQDIAGLDSITRVSPVTVRLVFDSDTPDS